MLFFLIMIVGICFNSFNRLIKIYIPLVVLNSIYDLVIKIFEPVSEFYFLDHPCNSSNSLESTPPILPQTKILYHKLLKIVLNKLRVLHTNLCNVLKYVQFFIYVLLFVCNSNARLN